MSISISTNTPSVYFRPTTRSPMLPQSSKLHGRGRSSTGPGLSYYTCASRRATRLGRAAVCELSSGTEQYHGAMMTVCQYNGITRALYCVADYAAEGRNINQQLVLIAWYIIIYIYIYTDHMQAI